jgi:tetratricopeptide (TPR) repeat protein
MSEQTIRRALGKLQDDPENEGAWAELQDAVTDPAGSGMGAEALATLLEAARREHQSRREDEAVAQLLELEALILSGTPREVELQAELARVYNEVLDDTKRAIPALERLAKLRPGDADIERRVAGIRDEKARWPEILKELMEAADRMEGKPAAQAGMVYTAAQTAFRYGLEGTADEVKATRQVIIERLEEALELAPDRKETVFLLERLYRAEQQWSDVARVLTKLALEAPEKDVRLASYIRLARVAHRKLEDEARAVTAYERVLDLAPGHEEAIAYLVGYFSKTEQWEHLVAVYEDALRARLRPGKELEIYFQIAMTHWRMRGKPELAEPYFERIRRAEPAHPAMLTFFRELLPAKGETQRLINVLTDAQRALGEGEARAAIVTELAKLSEEVQGAGKAIEHWKQALRADANNQEARDALKRLYYQTEAWPALVDLVRQQLERFGPNDEGRLPVLRELMQLHRDKTKQDTALVPVLNQLVALAPNDIDAVREQVRVYEALNRPRDLVTAQTRLAELEEKASVKGELWRSVARTWLDKFSNVQNAVEAYEKVLEQLPDDEEAQARLRELYGKRRAFKPLYDLLAKMRERATGEQKRELGLEMAKLAAERLDRGADAIEIYWSILAEEPEAPGVLDALEKQAERDKDFPALARVLGHRVEQATDDDAKIKLLEKLGGLYEARIKDPQKTIETWRRVLVLRPGYPKAVRILREEYLALGDYDGLTDVYAQQEDWEGLADALSGAADRASEADQKVALSWRVADVYVEKLKRPERAARSYERVLASRPDDARAAGALAPILEAESQWARLPAVYDVLLRSTEQVDEKVRILRRLRELAGGPLGDKPGAFDYARKAYALAATDELRDDLEASARAAGAFDGYVTALRERLALGASVVHVDEKRKLQGEIARVLGSELGKVDEAVAELRRVAQEDAEDDEALAALDRLLRQARRTDDLRDLYKLRLERAESLSAQVSLLIEWAQLEEEAFGESARALEVYRRALALEPQNRAALRAIARIELAAGDPAAAARALEQERDLAVGTERAEREIDLARLYLGPLGRSADALDAAVRALSISSHDAGAIAVLEQLELMPEHAAAAAKQLEGEYEALGAHDAQVRVLERLVGAETDAGERRALFVRLAAVHGDQRRDAGAALDVLLRAVRETPADLELWDRVGELGSATGRQREVATAYGAAIDQTEKPLPAEVDRELCERVSVLLEDKLSDPDAAIPYLARILANDPADAHAFNRQKQILTARERWDDLQRMYDRAIDALPDPVRRVELLAEVALVFEDLLDDPARAAAAYERVLAIDPENDAAASALDKLYQRTERWSALATLLASQLDRRDDHARLALENRLARLHLDRLGQPKEALGYAAAILERDIAHLDARTVARAVMESTAEREPATRVQAAEVLERVYLARDEARELDEVTAIRLREGGAELSREQRIELLRRLAHLRDERLADDKGAFAALSELVPLDPRDAELRAKLLDVARRSIAHAEVAAVLGRAADAAPEEPALVGEILLDQARVYENHLQDDRAAERVYRRVLALPKDDAAGAIGPALEALEAIYLTRSAHAELAEILALRVEHADDESAKKRLLGRLGEIRERELSDAPGAIAAWTARLDFDETDADALAALDRLYGVTGQWRELVAVLTTRERLEDRPDERGTLLRRAAEVLAGKLDDVPAAIESYRRLIDEHGPSRDDLAALSALHARAGSHRELAESIEGRLDLASEPSERVALLAQLGGLRVDHLDDLAGGLESYRDALMLEPSHAATRAALEALLTRADARAEAAALLRPLYEAESANEKLLTVLEIQADTTDDVHERLPILATATSVADDGLGDAKRAFGFAARGLRDAAGGDEIRAWTERVERLTARTEGWSELVALYKAIEPEIIDGDAKLDVTLRIAELSRDRLADREQARDYYVRALDQRGDEPRALVALEALYEAADDAPALLDILKRRVDVVTDPAERVRLLFKQAKLCEEKLKDPAGAIEALEQVAAGDGPPSLVEPAQHGRELLNEALRSLERLYGEVGRWNDVIALLERQIGPSDGGTRSDVELHHALGVVARAHLHDVDRALEEFRTALTLDTNFGPSVVELEGMLEDPELRARAAEILEPVYLARPDWRKVMHTLEVRLLDAQDPHERRGFLVRIASMHEDEGKDLGAALATYARLLAEDPSNEETTRELERVAAAGSLDKELLAVYRVELAKITSDDDASAKLAFRAGELAEKLGQVEEALALFRRAHAVDPASRQTFDAIDRLLRPLGLADDRIALYREALDHRFDAHERVALLRSIAELHRDARSDRSAAIDAFRELLDIEERDAAALDALEQLLSAEERWRELADLLERRADGEDSPEKAAPFRLQLGKVLDERLNDPEGAIDRYEQIVGAIPTHRGAVEALEAMLKREPIKARVAEILRPLYEGADDWKRLITLSDERLALTEDVHERTAILREVAKLWEERGEDLGKAFAAIRRAWSLDPEDGGLRAEADRLAERLGDWDALVESYEGSVAAVDPSARPELLRGLADLHDGRRDDPRRAELTLVRLYELDPDDVTVIERVDRLATLLGDWSTLDRFLERRAELAASVDEQGESYRRLGGLRRDMLEDAQRSIAAFERALEIDHENLPTLDALISLYEAKDDDAKLVDLYQRRVDATPADDEAQRYDLLMRRARRAEVGIKDAREAIASLQAALSVRPNDLEAARGLERLYEAEQMWPELLEAMRLRAATANDRDERTTLRRKIAELSARELSDPMGALEIYRQVLEEAPTDELSIAAVTALGQKDDELRTVAADVLEPVLRAAGRHADLVKILEMRLAAQQDAFERSKTLRSIALVSEEGLRDLPAARGALLRALDETPDDRQLREELEAVAGREGGTDGYAALADALEKKAASAYDAELARELLVALARIAEEKLSDDARAAAALAKATEQSGDLPELLAGLDRLYERGKKHHELADVLGRRIEVASEPVDRAELRRRLALVQIREFNRKREGLATLRSALEEVPDHAASQAALESLLDDAELFDEVSEALEPVYRQQNDHQKLAALFERRIDRAAPSERTRLRLELARVLEEKAGDAKAAQRQLERAVESDPTEPEAFAELERLLPITAQWSEASTMLAKLLESGESLPRDLARDFWVKLASWRKEHLGDLPGAEQAYVHALEKDPENLEILQTIESLQRTAGRERDLVATLRRRAKLEGSLEQKRTLLREAHALAIGGEGDAALGEAVLRELLAEDEANAWALEKLTEARREAKDFAEVFALLMRRGELSASSEEQSQLRHEAARVARVELGHAEQAIELYRELLDSSDGGVSDAAAASELRGLYGAAGRHRDLADLLSRLIDAAASASARGALRLELAALQQGPLGRSDDAIDTLRAVIDEEPTNTAAVNELSTLYGRLGKHEELAELLSSQADHASGRGETFAELSLRVRLGELYAGLLKDPARAIETYEAVLARDAKHVGALAALVRIHAARGDRQRQSEVLARLVEETPGNAGAELALDLAQLAAELKDDAGRERALRRALQLADLSADEGKALSARARKELRAHYQRTEQWTELAAILADEADLVEAPADKAQHLREAAEIHLQKRSAPAEAAALLEKATALVPDDRPLLLLLCDALSASGRGKDAAEVLRKIIESFGGKRSKELAVYYHRLAHALTAQGERDAALVELDMAFKIDPGNIVVLRDLGKLALEVADFDRAQKTFRALLLQKLDAQSGITKAEVFFYLGEISDKQGERAKAIQMFERAVETDNTLAKARERIAELKAAGAAKSPSIPPPKKD